MNLREKLDRSKSTERVDLAKYQSINDDDPLIQIASNDKILVKPCWTQDNNWEGERYRDYIAKNPAYDGIYVRAALAQRLTVAAQRLGDNYQLIIRAGHRPIEVQRTILKDCAVDYKRQHPSVSDTMALDYARTFVSDPSIALPPHVSGAAVDVDVRSTYSGELLDFGSNLNDFTEQSYLHCDNLTAEQRKNRLLLLTSMLSAGLASYRSEWWHYSYGDQVWAWFYGKDTSLYSPRDVNVATR
jgi:D-alanyl-D-alanine dipeptidase